MGIKRGKGRRTRKNKKRRDRKRILGKQMM